jgi:excinuclease ABC subunit A
MTKKTHEFDFSIHGITQNNLKNINVSGQAGEVVVVAGVSGSGKSTLVNDVIAAEAKRQEAMRRKTDDLYDTQSARTSCTQLRYLNAVRCLSGH